MAIITAKTAIGPYSSAYPATDDSGVLSSKSQFPVTVGQNGADVAPASVMNNPITGGVWNGRNATFMAAAFPDTTLGLATYSPTDAWEALMAGTEYTDGDGAVVDGFHNWGADHEVVDFGTNQPASLALPIKHMVFDGSTDYDTVDTSAATGAGIVNPWTPDVSAGVVAEPDTLNAQFRTAYPNAGKQRSWPDQTGADLYDGAAGTTHNANASANPSANRARLGGWLRTDLSLGDWTSPSCTLSDE